MFDVSWSELALIAVVALVVVGPKDLPVLLRTLGKWAGVLRRMAGEFRSQFDEAMREAELHELKTVVEEIKKPLTETEQQVSASFRQIEKSVQETQQAAAVPAPPATAAPSAAASSTADEAHLSTAADHQPAPALSPDQESPSTPTQLLRPAEPSAVAGEPVPVNGAHAEVAEAAPPAPPEPTAARPPLAQRAAEAWKKAAGDHNGA